MHRIVAALSLLLVLFAAPVAQAQDTARHRELSTRFVTLVFEAYGFDNMLDEMTKSMTGELAGETAFPPEWSPLILEAAKEEMAADRLQIMAIMGSEIGRSFTEAELEVGIAMFGSPAGKEMMRARAENREPQLTRQQEREIEAISRRPAAESFARKMGALDFKFDSVEDEMMRTFLPGFFRRVGEKAEAYEARRDRSAAIPNATDK